MAPAEKNKKQNQNCLIFYNKDSKKAISF